MSDCDCPCCRRAGATIGELAGKRIVDIERTAKSLEMAGRALDQRDRWRRIARHLFRLVNFASPAERACVILACPGIDTAEER